MIGSIPSDPLNIGAVSNNFLESLNINNPELDENAVRRMIWHYNISEGLIYIKEGEHNIKYTHPTDLKSYKYYKILTGKYFSMTEIMTILFILLLMLLQNKSYNINHVDVVAIVQFFPLSFLMAIYLLKIKVMGIENISKKRYLIFNLIILVAIFCQKIYILAFKNYRNRFIQSLLPLFLYDSPYLTSSRRFIRQSFKILPKFMGILILTLLVILIYSLMGFSMFRDVPGDYHFSSFARSFHTMFVLFTTSNSPDAIMAQYHFTKLTVIFYTSFLTISTFIILNVLLAVTYQLYVFEEKAKIKKIILSQRRSCRAAFKLLVSTECPQGITKGVFNVFMAYHGEKNLINSMSLFSLIDSSNKGYICLNDFYNFYKYVDVVWNHQTLRSYSPLSRIFKNLSWLRKSKIYTYITYLVIAINSTYLVYENSSTSYKYRNMISPIDIFFSIVFAVETIIFGCILGPSFFFSCFSNFIDITINILSLASIFSLKYPDFLILRCFSIFRCLRILNLFKIYRDLCLITEKIIKRILSVSLAAFLIYFSLAFFAMQLFGEYDLRNCCKGSPLEDTYSNDTSLKYSSFYYENNFNSVLSSFVVLFELSVVNNWYLTMEAYAIIINDWTRIFFMLFYFYATIIITMSVAYIMEAFIFIFCKIREETNFENAHSVYIDSPFEESEGERIVSDGFKRLTIENITEQLYKDDIAECIEADESLLNS